MENKEVLLQSEKTIEDMQNEIEDVKKKMASNVEVWDKRSKENPKAMEKLLNKMNTESIKYMEKMKKEAAKAGLKIDLAIYATTIEELQKSDSN